MCRTVAYRHACNHTTLHTVKRCRLTYVAPTPANAPLCSGHRTPCTELIRLATPCLGCEYRAFTSAWEQRISTVRARLDSARQSLRDLDREADCAVDDDWNCCADVDFVDESLFSNDSRSSASDDSDAADDDYSDWFSFVKPDTSVSAWEAHGMLSQGQSPQRAVRTSALRTRLVGEEKVAVQMLADVRDEYEVERLRSWSGYLKASSSKPIPGAAKEPGRRTCAASRLRQVTNASDFPDEAAAEVKQQTAAKEIKLVREPPQRRQTEPAPISVAPVASTPTSVRQPAAPVVSPPRRSFTTNISDYRPKPTPRSTILRSCSLEQTWPLGKARNWLDEAQDSGIALPDYGF